MAETLQNNILHFTICKSQSFLDKTKDPSRINYMDDVSTSVNEEATELKINEQTKHTNK